MAPARLNTLLSTRDSDRPGDRVARHAKWVAYVGTIALLVLMVGVTALTLAGLAQQSSVDKDIRSTLDAIRATQLQNRSTNNLVADCVTPGRECYRRSQAQTGKAVVSINTITVLAAECARDPKVSDVKACVMARLAKQGG